MLGFPARFFIDFFDRHGFLSVDDRPVWQTVTGGTRTYVRALLAQTPARVRLSTPVESIRRQPNQVQVRTRRGEVETFDYAFLGCHSDQALALLDEPSRAESDALGATALRGDGGDPAHRRVRPAEATDLRGPHGIITCCAMRRSRWP